ncbi:MAG TPA: clostripain-related cysteine peptidase, partial [Pyrinomonadaceae bacterium]
MPQRKEWTLMFYFASDNPLAQSIVSQLKAIKDAGFHPEANVIARYDPHTEQTPTHVFDINRLAKLRQSGGSRVGFANEAYVRNLVLDKLWSDDNESDKEIREKIKKALNRPHNGNGRGERDAPGVELDMPVLPKEFCAERPPRESLEDFLRFCAKEYPARRYMLFILGHGVVVGNDFFLFDEHVDEETDEDAEEVSAEPAAAADAKGGDGAARPPAGRKRGRSGNSLSLKGLGEVLRNFKRDYIKKDSEFELLGFHSCSMSGLEVCYELRDTANYLLASQGPAFVGSWPYKQILMRVFNDLNSPLLTVGDLSDGRLATRLKAGGDAATDFLRGRLSEGTRALLGRHEAGRAPELGLVRGLARELNEVLKDGSLLSAGPFPAPRPGARAGSPRRESRERLAALFPEVGVAPRVDARDVKDLVTKVFYYILYNSYDFQLAGYSFDLCLCDLTKVGEAGEAVSRLSAALKAALAGDAGLGGGGA